MAVGMEGEGQVSAEFKKNLDDQKIADMRCLGPVKGKKEN